MPPTARSLRWGRWTPSCHTPAHWPLGRPGGAAAAAVWHCRWAHPPHFRSCTSTGSFRYSNKARGMRNKAAAEPSAEPSSRPPLRGGARDTPVPRANRCSQTWAMLIKRVYEVDPLSCPRCGGQMKVVALIEPPQGGVIERILRGHQSVAMVGGLWHPSTPRAPPAGDGSVRDPDAPSDRQTGSSDEPTGN
jgi:hypothetical protein